MQPFNKRIKKGEAAAFVELYEQLGEKLYRYVFSQIGSAPDASDVVQDVFVRLVKSHRTLAKAKNLNSYVFVVARNETIRWVQKQKRARLKGFAETVPEEAQDTCEFHQAVEDEEWVKNILDQLGAVDREIVQLKVFSQLTFLEISAVMNLPPTNVSTRYRRAIEKLQSRLEESPASNQLPRESGQ
ncbi:MAG: RNA polymerase sigma-70 factor (ECF subfamily) [Mariniblastus sp.]|jgi:RNA polymerase sigma-70 factor (ECF subfamily)